jgi:hypothetical protein
MVCSTGGRRYDERFPTGTGPLNPGSFCTYLTVFLQRRDPRKHVCFRDHRFHPGDPFLHVFVHVLHLLLDVFDVPVAVSEEKSSAEKGTANTPNRC